MKLKRWLRDKYNWLLTFNKPPVVDIKANYIECLDTGEHCIKTNGRVTIRVDVETLKLITQE